MSTNVDRAHLRRLIALASNITVTFSFTTLLRLKEHAKHTFTRWALQGRIVGRDEYYYMQEFGLFISSTTPDSAPLLGGTCLSRRHTFVPHAYYPTDG